MREEPPHAPKDVNYVMWLDAQLNVLKQDILDEAIFTNDASSWSSSIQDIRLFMWNSQVWGIVTIGNPSAGTIGQVILKLDGNKII